MTDVEQHKNREFFISVAHEYIKRPGVSELLAYLNQKTDFFWAPASLNAHLSEPGGLCQHSINVLETALRIYKSVLQPYACLGASPENEGLTEESIAVVALFHDVCKSNTFRKPKSAEKMRKANGKVIKAMNWLIVFPLGKAKNRA